MVQAINSIKYYASNDYSSLAEGSKSVISGEGVNISKKINSFNGDFSAPYTMLPEGERNYCLFNQNKTGFIASQKERAIPYLKQILETSEDEKEIVEALYIVDRLCDNGTKGVAKLYPTLARFNDTKSANIQTFLAGIYRKTQVPDAFGPLVKMLVQNSLTSAKTPADEEIGGAILEYIRNYSNNPKAIDYSA